MEDRNGRAGARKWNIQQMRKQLADETIRSPKRLSNSPVTGGKLKPVSGYHSGRQFGSMGLGSLQFGSPKSNDVSQFMASANEISYHKKESSLFEPYNYTSDSMHIVAEPRQDQSMFATFDLERTTMMSAADLSSMSMMVEKDPELYGSGVLFENFKKSLQTYCHAGQVFELIACYEKLCRDHIQKLLGFVSHVDPTRSRFQSTTRMINFLYQECYTWRLIGSLIKDKLHQEIDEMNEEKADVSLIQDQFPSFKRIIEKLFNREPSTRYCQLIVDWLEKNAEDKINDFIATDNLQFTSDSVSWEHTLHTLNMLSTSKGGSRFVTELDPDAPIRQRRPLADLDQDDENRLMKYVFMFLRAGKLEEAKDICIKYGQSWRAATLDGWRLWHDANFEDSTKNGEMEITEGNPFGLIWKSCCWKLSEDTEVSTYEKAIYSALSGNLRQLLSVCGSWEDRLWAYFKVLVDGKVEQELRHVINEDESTLPKEYYEVTENLTPQKIFEELNTHADDVVRTEGKEFFHLFQKHMILDEQQNLLKEVDMLMDESDRISTHMLRFLAHIVLFFQTVGLQLDEDLYVKILQRYIVALISKEQWDQVALYTAKLPPDIQIDTYAEFLEQVEVPSERERFAQLAREEGLDVKAIAKRVVENIRERNPDELQDDSSLTAGDKKKIESIEWLILEPTQRIEAVVQANAIIRGFITAKKLEPAKEVFKKLPKDSIDIIQQEWEAKAGSSPLPPEYENAKKEYLCIKAYLDAHSAFDAWFQHFHNNAPVKPKQQKIKTFKEQVTFEANIKEYTESKAMWKRTLDTHVMHVSEKVYNVLLFPEGWMVDIHADEDANSTRNKQMKHIQEVSIPFLSFLLHTVLHSSGKYKECLQIADVIQSEQRKLYTLFRKADLQKLLGLLKDSSMCLLNENQDFLGYDVPEIY
ncbi:nuclear pore complex protein Nup107-like [Rhopilema esculentum]|uniref:nuclear pore complex protein Nup107-like n=1 Tax=Rhopilema esculentum TaxID=499914 RepID=UPI0031DA4DD2|eukprot:gene2795-1018_t